MKTTRTFKGQSAMEYLMTYGWAILIIAIVLAALFSLGVFSGTLPTAEKTLCPCAILRITRRSAKSACALLRSHGTRCTGATVGARGTRAAAANLTALHGCNQCGTSMRRWTGEN